VSPATARVCPQTRRSKRAFCALSSRDDETHGDD
jgi:hypothetical protein